MSALGLLAVAVALILGFALWYAVRGERTDRRPGDYPGNSYIRHPKDWR